MDGNKVWYWAHFGVTAALAVLVVLSFVTLGIDGDLFFTYSLHAVVVFLFVMPGALLVFAINHLILWRRKPRVITVADKVVISVVAGLTLITALSSFSFEIGLVVVFFSVPLLMIAGIVSTIFIAVGNTRAGRPQVLEAPVEPGTAPVAATLDELFPEPGTPPVPLGEPGATPYGPKS